MTIKKLIVWCALILLPVFLFAQSGTSVYKDLSKKIAGIDQTFKLNDHESIMMLTLDDENFELVAIDDKMQVLWRTTLKGTSIGAGLFNGQVLAIGASGISRSKGLISPFIGFMLDKQTGKLLLQKTIYNSDPDTQELPMTFFNTAGTDFKLVIRQTNAYKSFPFSAGWNYEKNLGLTMETKDFTIVSLNEKLDATIAKPKIPHGYVLTMKCNDKGDLFVAVYEENAGIKISRYEKGKTEPSEISQTIDLVKIEENLNAAMCVSKTDDNIVYYAQAHKNHNKDRALTVIKFDFNKHASSITNEVFDKAHVKSIEKGYVQFDKTLDKPEIVNGQYDISFLSVRHIEENQGNVVVVLSVLDLNDTRNFDTAPSSLVRMKNMHLDKFTENAIVINGYDVNLKQKFQQVLPVHYFWEQPWTAGYHLDGNSFFVVANTTQPNHFSVFGKLDLNTGNWANIEKLPFERSRVASNNILWFKSNLIIPAIERVGITYPQKENIDLIIKSY